MFSLTENPALAALGGVTTRQADMPPAARTVSAALCRVSPSGRAQRAQDALEGHRSHGAQLCGRLSVRAAPHTSHARPAPSERVLRPLSASCAL